MTALLRVSSIFAAGIAGGVVSWNTSFPALGLAAALPIAWQYTRSRTEAFTIAFGYYLGAACGIPPGAAVFFGDGNWLAGTALWISGCLLLSTPWAALWLRNPRHRGVAAVAALAICAVPPLGIIGWASPLAAAGVLLPSSGFAGLGLFGLVVMTWHSLVHHFPRPLAAVLTLIASLAAILAPTPSAPAGWGAIQTHFGGLGYQREDYLRDYENNKTLIAMATRSPHRVTVFPEVVAGWWSEGTDQLWQDAREQLAREGATAFVGAVRRGPSGRANSMIALGAQAGTLDQSIPVPAGMWRPWAADSFPVRLAVRSPMVVDDRSVVAIVCYEQVLVWPYLTAAFGGAQVWLAPANNYWAGTSGLPGIQKRTLRAWSRLFNVPFIWAENT